MKQKILITNKKRRVYSLSENLSPEERVVTFAKCSRSPKSFDEIIKELTVEKTSEFTKRWVIGFGHLSVAEHAVFSIAMENISILATKVIEDNRLASFTEKSTRYQTFNETTYYKPKKIINSMLAKIYQETADYLFQTYNEFYPIINKYIKEKISKTETMTDSFYESICKAKTCDIIRYLLPTATLTNLGITINARNLLQAIKKLLSHPLMEMQEIGQELKQLGQKNAPTLFGSVEPSEYLQKTVPIMDNFVRRKLKGKPKNSQPVELVEYDKNAEERILTSILYRFSNQPYNQIKSKVKKMSRKEREKFLDKVFKNKGQLEVPLRELEHTYYTFDILVDYGAFRDIQRHRICTQTNQLVTVEHGFDIPEEIIEIGLKNKFVSACQRSAKAYEKIAKQFPYEAQYIVALAFKKRVLFTWNLRELYHFISLRTGITGHISYRRIAYQIYQQIAKVHPLITKYIHVIKVG